MEINLISVRRLLYTWVTKVAKQENIQWIDKKLDLLTDNNAQVKDLFLAFSAAPKFAGKSKIELAQSDLNDANTARNGWFPKNITTDEAVRTLFVISFKHSSKEAYFRTIESLFATGDVRELVTLYKALPVLPYQENYTGRAAEGIRSNMKNVFEAVALNNPYPFENLDEASWNQLILKAVFVESPLHQIYGLDKRSNQHLSAMLSDFAHERWAAHRKVSPELWRAVGSHVTTEIIKDLRKVITDPNPIQYKAAALACYYSLCEEAKKIIDTDEEIKNKITTGELTWETLAAEMA